MNATTHQSRQENVYNIFQTVSLMQYQPGQDYDYYYPTIDELNKLGQTDKHGNVVYSETDLAFLVWVMHPIDPENISDAQKQCMAYAAQLLHDYVEGTEVIDEKERSEMEEILRKYNQKKQNS